MGVHLVVLLLLFVLLMPPAQLPALPTGILVNIGDVAMAEGSYRPEEEIVPPVEPEQLLPEPSPETEQLLTQEVDTEAPALPQPEEKKSEEQTRTETQARVTEAQRRQEAERAQEAAEAKRKAEIADKVSGAFGNAKEHTGSGGTKGATPTGREGAPRGNTIGGGAGSGVAGFGGWSLEGRDIIGALRRPDFTKNVEGRIVVSITVNAAGTVISAAIAPGTTIGDHSMQQSALKAARSTRFSRAEQVNNQRGTITYRYELN